MNFFGTKEKPPLYVRLAAVSLMILAGTVVGLTILTPVFVVLSPILLPAIITSSFLATGFLASGSLGASAIALLIWLYKKEEHSRYTLHARGIRPEGANKLVGANKQPKQDKPPKEDKLAEDHKPLVRNKPAEEDKLPERDKSPERNKPAEEDKPLGVEQAQEETSIPEISKVLLEEQNPRAPKCCGPTISTKVRSIFMKEYQKVPRVGAFAYKYFTSRDKNT